MASSSNQLVTNSQGRSLTLKKPVKTTAEQEQALRDQLHIEIENKSKACSNPTFDCSIPRIEGYEYCIRHILQDPRAPFKQCAYTYASNGKRCLQPAPKYEGKKEASLTNYCFEHSRLIQLTKTHNTVGKYKLVETNESLLNDLSHHIKIEGTTTSFTETDEEIDVVSPNADPFIHYVHSADFDRIVEEKPPKRRLLDYASDSSSDEDVPTVSNTWPSHEWDNSDNESVDSQNEDLLKHAGIYTTEEATNITKQKMMRLQVLYMEQLLRLQHLLKEKRRKYLHAIKKERETLCSIHDQPKETPQERKVYQKYKTLHRYHRRFGMEAVLYQKYKEKRDRATEGAGYKPPAFPKCIFSEGGVKCGERVIPSCKYCKKHILEDKKQVLFRACGVDKSGVVCQEPVPCIFENATCVLHLSLPPPRAYSQKKFESETEEEDEAIVDTKNLELKQEADDNATANLNMLSTQVSEVTDSQTSFSRSSDPTKELSQDTEMLSTDNLPEQNVTISHDNDNTVTAEILSTAVVQDDEMADVEDMEMEKLEVTDSPKPEDIELTEDETMTPTDVSEENLTTTEASASTNAPPETVASTETKGEIEKMETTEPVEAPAQVESTETAKSTETPEPSVSEESDTQTVQQEPKGTAKSIEEGKLSETVESNESGKPIESAKSTESVEATKAEESTENVESTDEAIKNKIDEKKTSVASP